MLFLRIFLIYISIKKKCFLPLTSHILHKYDMIRVVKCFYSSFRQNRYRHLTGYFSSLALPSIAYLLYLVFIVVLVIVERRVELSVTVAQRRQRDEQRVGEKYEM